ncbi:MAG: hypothetical protein R8L07_10400 [Alphaproteobacteria bacterium]|nr:hypothetical protein [Alphaproteobacteria bacterium]
MRRSVRSASTIRKARDIAVVIPVVCTFLIMPPLIHIASGAGSIFGIPAVVVYLFGIWIAAVALTAWNSRRLDTPDHEDAFRIDGKDLPP